MTGRKTSVSLCMIVRDEEQNLSSCLASLDHLFDEIVVVDTGSRDQTRQVARQFTPHVVDFPWSDDFSAARNESMRRARGEWIFWLDADDRFQPENLIKLRALLENLDDQRQVFLMDTASVSSTVGVDPSLVTHPRLFRRHPDLHWEGRVHEQLRPEPVDMGYQPILSNVQIEHLGYQHRVERQRKLRRNFRLLSMDYAVDPDNWSTLLHLGVTQLGLGNIGDARKHLFRIVDADRASIAMLRCAYAILADLSLYEGKVSEAVRFAERGLRLVPEDEHLLYTQAQALYELKEYAAAVRVLGPIIHGAAVRQTHFGSVGNIGQKLAPHLLGAIRYMQRAYAEAESTITALLHEFPDHVGSWYNLGLVYVAIGNRQKLERVVSALDGCPGGGVDARLLRARWHLRHGKLATAGNLIEEIIIEAPQLACPRMLRAEWLSRSGAPLDAQIRALADVLRIEPGHSEARRWITALERAKRGPAQAPVAAEAWSHSVVLMPGVAVG